MDRSVSGSDCFSLENFRESSNARNSIIHHHPWLEILFGRNDKLKCFTSQSLIVLITLAIWYCGLVGSTMSQVPVRSPKSDIIRYVFLVCFPES